MGGGTGGGSTGTGGGTTMVPAPRGCLTDVTAGHHKFAACDTIDYDVEIPPACASGGCGIIFDIHGLTMNADAEDRSTNLRALGQMHGYVIVQPTAPNSVIGPHWTPLTDDVKLWAFLADARIALVIDPKKIHFTGFSQGGAMTWRLLCAHADVFASVAPVASADGTMAVTPPYVLDCPFTSTNAPSQPVPVLQMHGTQDGLVPFAKATDQRDTALTYWNITGPPDTVGSDMHYSWTRYTGTGGMVYEFIQHDYVVPTPLVPITLGGHCLPGGNDLTPSISTPMVFSCSPPNAFVWGEVAMQFFIAHPKP
jgi:hypothetical protein